MATLQFWSAACTVWLQKPEDMHVFILQEFPRDLSKSFVAPASYGDPCTGMNSDNRRSGGNTQVAKQTACAAQIFGRMLKRARFCRRLDSDGSQELQPYVGAMGARKVRGDAVREKESATAEAIANAAAHAGKPEQ